MPNFRLTGSQILWQQLFNYANMYSLGGVATVYLAHLQTRISRGHLQELGIQLSVQSPFSEIPVSCGETSGGCKDGVSLPKFPESTSVASRCVADLNPVPQVEVKPVSWSSKRAFFTGRLGMCFILWSIQCPGDGSLPRTVF